MPRIFFNQQSLSCIAGESLLECLLRHQQSIPHGCRAGACQSCRVKLAAETPMSAEIRRAQYGLSPQQCADGVALSCQLQVLSEMSVSGLDSNDTWQRATVLERRQLSEDVWEIVLDSRLRWQAGQYFSLSLNGIDTRSYSAANCSESGPLKIQLRAYPKGQVSAPLCRAPLGSTVYIQGPLGEFCLRDDRPAKRFIMLGSGTGIAPLLALARQACDLDPLRPLVLIASAAEAQSLYRCREFDALCSEHNVEAHQLLWSKGGDSALDSLLQRLAPLDGDQCYLSGPEHFVQQYQRRLFMLGASRAQIYTESFINFRQHSEQ